MNESWQERLERLTRERDEMNARLRDSLRKSGANPEGIVFGYGELDDAEGDGDGVADEDR